MPGALPYDTDMDDERPTPALAGLLRRLIVMVYDGMLILAVLFIGTIPWVLARPKPTDGTLNFESLGIVYQIYLLALVVAYFVVAWHRKQATLGMRAWRMQLRSLDGSPLSTQQMLQRLVAAPLAWLPAAIGILWQYRDRDVLTWHDRLSSTRIVLVKKDAKR